MTLPVAQQTPHKLSRLTIAFTPPVPPAGGVLLSGDGAIPVSCQFLYGFCIIADQRRDVALDPVRPTVYTPPVGTSWSDSDETPRASFPSLGEVFRQKEKRQCLS